MELVLSLYKKLDRCGQEILLHSPHHILHLDNLLVDRNYLHDDVLSVLRRYRLHAGHSHHCHTGSCDFEHKRQLPFSSQLFTYASHSFIPCQYRG